MDKMAWDADVSSTFNDMTTEFFFCCVVLTLVGMLCSFGVNPNIIRLIPRDAQRDTCKRRKKQEDHSHGRDEKFLRGKRH
jgi:hypothetical protein